jgi:hypothetical protein
LMFNYNYKERKEKMERIVGIWSGYGLKLHLENWLL